MLKRGLCWAKRVLRWAKEGSVLSKRGSVLSERWFFAELKWVLCWVKECSVLSESGFCAELKRVLHGALSPTSVLTSLQFGHHVVLYWLVNARWFASNFSNKMSVICFIWLQLISLISDNMCCCLFWRFSVEPTSLSLCCYALTCAKNMVATVWAGSQRTLYSSVLRTLTTVFFHTFLLPAVSCVISLALSLQVGSQTVHDCEKSSYKSSQWLLSNEFLVSCSNSHSRQKRALD